MKIFERVKKEKFPLKFKLFFYRLLTYTSFTLRTYKLSSDNKIFDNHC